MPPQFLDTPKATNGTGEASIRTPSSVPSRPPRHHLHHKRPFIDAFTDAFDESKSVIHDESMSQIFDNYISPHRISSSQPQGDIFKGPNAIFPPRGADNTEDTDATAEKFTTLVKSVGACAYACADLVSSLVVNGTKLAYSCVNTHDTQKKRRRLNSDATLEKDSLSVDSPSTSSFIFDTTGLTPVRIPGAFDPIYDEGKTQQSEIEMKEASNLSINANRCADSSGDLFASPNPTGQILLPGSPMNLDIDMTTPEKHINFNITEPRTYKPSVTPSFNPRGNHKIVPDSPTKAGNLRAVRLFDGLRRHKLGILDYSNLPIESTILPDTPQEPQERGFVGLNRSGEFKFDPTRLLNRKPLPYADSWYYQPPKVELPEEAPSREFYVDLYMQLVAQREQREREAKEEEKKREQLTVPPLDLKDRRKVEVLWTRKDLSTELVSAYRIGISVYDIGTLRDGQWLNDNVIDFYLSMITERSTKSNGKLPKSFAFSTHFFSTLSSRGYNGVARWAKRKGVDVTKLDYIFVPINRHNTHWCLAVINNRDLRFEFYDSMNGAGAHALELLRDYMENQTLATYANSNRSELGYDKYDMCLTLPCPQQSNSYDCGVFVSKMVEVLSRDLPVNSFSQKDMPNIRRRMAHEIITQTLFQSIN